MHSQNDSVSASASFALVDGLVSGRCDHMENRGSTGSYSVCAPPNPHAPPSPKGRGGAVHYWGGVRPLFAAAAWLRGRSDVELRSRFLGPNIVQIKPTSHDLAGVFEPPSCLLTSDTPLLLRSIHVETGGSGLLALPIYYRLKIFKADLPHPPAEQALDL
ncbi:hypothetical protein HYALB_00007664 [Hymenoscyphus albidus]|uniref:Uncharacterized protein n=1 Tax=Hymenoscyphus albidus TaxID=595503 RepID=A0A9N9Q2G8_9HELO|nr:hypothetical protein HYALB_00007664 [Hymenoscyphus albidus]